MFENGFLGTQNLTSPVRLGLIALARMVEDEVSVQFSEVFRFGQSIVVGSVRFVSPYDY